MAFSVNTLPDYVEQHKGELLSKAILGFETRNYINLQPGVKYKEALNILATDPVIQERTCGFDASGNVSFTQRIMTVAPYKVNMSLCEEDLRKKWMANELITRAGGEVLPMEERIAADITKKIANDLEKKVWNASAAVDGFDGFLNILDQEADVIDASLGASTYDSVINVYKKVPANVIDKAEIFCGQEAYRDFILEITAKNLYHHNPAVDNSHTVIIPGTNTPLHGVPGLNNTGRFVAADPENLFYGFDGSEDADTLDLWYSKDNQEFRLAVKFNAGAQVAFPDEVVISEKAE